TPPRYFTSPSSFHILLCSTLSSLLLFFFYSSGHLRDLHSFPTRRSSDLAALYEHALLASRVNQRIQGHGESRRHSHRQFHVDKHVRTQGKSGVVRFEPQLQSPGNGIDLRKGVTHACRKGFSLIGSGRVTRAIVSGRKSCASLPKISATIQTVLKSAIR